MNSLSWQNDSLFYQSSSKICKSFPYLWQLKCLFIFKEVPAEVSLHHLLIYFIYMGSKTHYTSKQAGKDSDNSKM